MIVYILFSPIFRTPPIKIKLSDIQHPMLVIGHGFYRTTPQAPPAPEIEAAIKETIMEGDSDRKSKLYLNYVEYLMNGQVQYDMFARICPNNTCERTAIYIKNRNAHAWPSKSALKQAITERTQNGYSVAISLVTPGHAGMLWFDAANRTIERFDPAVPNQMLAGKMEIMHLIRKMFPDWTWKGSLINRLENCVQRRRHKFRNDQEGIREHGDWFCQLWSILFSILRIRGYDYRSAVDILCNRRDDILIDMTALLRLLVDTSRAVRLEPPPSIADITFE